MDAARKLFNSGTESDFLAALALYPALSRAVYEAKGQNVLQLDADNEFSVRTRSSSEVLTVVPTRQVLSLVVQWKLRRGTFRPGLLQKAESNTDAKLADAWRKAAKAMLDERGKTPGEEAENKERRTAVALAGIKAIDKELFGVGPATASVLLARVLPEFVAVMSDEALLASGLFDSKGALKYDAKTFSKLNILLLEKAQELTKSGGKKTTWVVDDVQRALWAAFRADGVAGADTTTSQKNLNAGEALLYKGTCPRSDEDFLARFGLKLRDVPAQGDKDTGKKSPKAKTEAKVAKAAGKTASRAKPKAKDGVSKVAVPAKKVKK
ncbi:unnamed protein product [Amoebophrya sp. A25]|nr:unnamed protein product [Amoebophrya sp. A25]|eukprot:GSA25T00000661001.1